MSRPTSGFFKRKELPPSNKKGCGDRDTTLFTEFLKEDPVNIHLLIARALLNNNQLDWFELETDQPHGNECVFSYPDSDWYSVYLKTPNGEIVWTTDDETGEIVNPKFYFRINISQDGKDATIIESTFDVPQELKQGRGIKQNCQIIDGVCSDPVKKSNPRSKIEQARTIAKTLSGNNTPSPPSGSKRRGRPPKNIPEEPGETRIESINPEMLAQLTSLTASGSSGASTSGTKNAPGGKVSRDYFEKMQSKSQIVDWMIANLDRNHLVACIQKHSGAVNFNPAELTNINLLAKLPYNEEQVTIDDLPAIRAVEGLGIRKATGILKKWSYASIKKELMESLTGLEPGPKNEAIVNFCVHSGINKFKAGVTKKGIPRIFEDDEPVDSGEVTKEVIDVCVAGEVSRLQRTLASGLRKYAKQLPDTAQEVPELLEVSEIEEVPDFELQIQDILTLSGVTLMNAVAQFCNNLVGKELYVVKEKNKKFKLYDPDGDPVDSGDYEELMRSLIPRSSFGFGRRISKKQKAHRLKFKKAVKKCKKSGVKNFRKCMSKNLKKKKN
jgi:hypothetical protein